MNSKVYNEDISFKNVYHGRMLRVDTDIRDLPRRLARTIIRRYGVMSLRRMVLFMLGGIMRAWPSMPVPFS